MIPGHNRARCEAPERVLQNFGHVTCHRTTPGNPTDITATYSRSIEIIRLEMQLSCLLHLRTMLPRLNMSGEAEERGRRVVLGLPELSNVYSTHHGDSSCATEPQDATAERANPGRQRQAKGCRHLLVKPRAKARERETRANCGGPLSATRAGSLGSARRSKAV